ncbi:MAG: hypothetical protein USCGTAYLOR_01739 [Chromatiales bacterium USCg_Taylor]|nr:MAG: hypothetical protein USCGTAYLOR_01739 [Chromatiales bacterium USCg_Taylor]
MVRNLYNGIPDTISEELFETLLEEGRFQLERIVSSER